MTKFCDDETQVKFHKPLFHFLDFGQFYFKHPARGTRKTRVILSCVIFYFNENEIVQFIISSIMLNKVREHGYATSTHREMSKDSII